MHFWQERSLLKDISHYYTTELWLSRERLSMLKWHGPPHIRVTPGFCKSSTELIIMNLQQGSHHSLSESLPMPVKHLGREKWQVLVLSTKHFWLSRAGSVSKGWIQFLFLSRLSVHQYLKGQAWEEGTSTQQIKQLQNKRNPIQLFPASGLSNESDIRVLCVVFLQLCSFFLHY